MDARTVDDAAERLRALRQDELANVGLSALALGLAVVATQVYPQLSLPLLLGGLAAGTLGVRALWRRYECIERLAGDRDAYAISEVFSYALREATMERRHTYATLIRSRLPHPGTWVDPRVAAAAGELEELAAELDDETLALDPRAAVACMRMLSDLVESPLLNTALPVEDLRACVRRIRAGFRAREHEMLRPGTA
jgi:hypothetical protein